MSRGNYGPIADTIRQQLKNIDWDSKEVSKRIEEAEELLKKEKELFVKLVEIKEMYLRDLEKLGEKDEEN